MSLEEALNRNSDLLAEHNELLKQVLGKAAAKTGASNDDAGAGKDEPKATRGRKPKGEGDGAASGPTFDQLKKDLVAWSSEFAKEADKDNPDGAHPEVLARKAALKKAFESEKLKIGNIREIENDPAKIEILFNWLHNTAKKADKGFGIGRLAADPVSSIDDGDGDGDDGLGI